MTQNQNLSAGPVQPVQLGKRMFWGVIPAFLIVMAFLWSVSGKDDPAWGNYWMIRPIVIMCFAGAVGGAVYAFLDGLRMQLHWNRTLIIILCFIIYLFGLWMGMVLGFNGTYWH